jgi:hypothetical protein
MNHEHSLAYQSGYEISALRRAVQEYRDALAISKSTAWSGETKRRLVHEAIQRAEEALARADTMTGEQAGV